MVAVGETMVLGGSVKIPEPSNAECFAFVPRLKPKSMSYHSSIKYLQWRGSSCRGT